MISSRFGIPSGDFAASGCQRIAIVLMLAVVVLASGAAAPTARAQDVTIGYQPIINPWKVAIADQTIEEATGYTVNWRRFNSSNELNSALYYGQVDIVLRGSAGFAALLTLDIPYKLFWIAETIDTAEALVVRDGAGIATASDLRGKRIAAPIGSTTHFHLLVALEQFGIGADEVTLMYLDPDEIVEAWEADEIDAAFVWYPALGQLLTSGSVLITSGELAERGTATFDGMLARNQFAESNPGFMCRFVQILAEADANYRDNPASFGPGTPNAAKIARLASADEATVAEVLALYDFLPLEVQAGRDWLGGGAARTLMSTAEFFIDQGLLQRTSPDYAGAVTPEYVNAAIRGCPAWSGPATSVSQLLDPAWVRNASPGQVEKLVNLDADLSAAGGGYRLTALHVAAGWNENPSVTELLLNRGADIDATDSLGRTALHLASRRNRNPAVAELLIERGASTEATDDKGWSILTTAQAGGNARIATVASNRAERPEGVAPWQLLYGDWAETATVESLSKLLDYDHTIVSNVGPRGSLLHRLARFNPDPAAITLLLDRGADVQAVDWIGENALFKAALGKNPEVVALLVERGIPVDAKNEFDETALFRAASYSDPAVVAMFLDLGADPSGEEYGAYTALHSAAANENPAVAALLLDRGADITKVTNFFAETPLMTATRRGNLETAALLLDRGSDPNETAFANGPSSLHIAAVRGNAEMARLLIERGASVGATDGQGNTPLDNALRYSTRWGTAAVVDLLLQRGADRDKVGPAFWSRTATRWLRIEPVDRAREWLQRIPSIDQGVPDAFLEAAISNPDPAVATLLLDRGADPNAKGINGHTVLHWAAAREEIDLAQLLIDRGADVNARDGWGSTPLHWATRRAIGAEMASLLVESGADVTATDNHRQTPLHWTAYLWTNAPVAAVRQLIDLGVDPDAVDQFDRTALHWAARRNRAEIVKAVAAEVADLNPTDRGGATPLTLARLNPRWAVTQELLNRGAMENPLEERLLDAAWLSRATLIQIDAQIANASTKHLLQRDGCGRTPLHLISHYAGRDLVRLTNFNERYKYLPFWSLMRRSDFTDIDVPDRNGNTALHYAVAGSARNSPPHLTRIGAGYEAVRRLRDAGADTAAVGGGGLWPVHYASRDQPRDSLGFSVFRYLSGHTDPSIDPLTYAPFPEGRVPADRLDACIVDLP